MRMLLTLSALLFTSTASADGFPPAAADEDFIRVVDATGADVEDCEVMWHTADQGYCRWTTPASRDLTAMSADAKVIDIVVRADGYATTVQRFQGDSLKELLTQQATITLHRGREVRLKLNLPDGMVVPEDFLPQMYFVDFAWRVRMMWQPVNQRGIRTPPDFDMLNVSRVAPDVYAFRVADDTPDFLIAFQHPGWLRFYEAGPFGSDALESGQLELEVPRPSTLRISLDTGDRDESRLPFSDAIVGIAWPNPTQNGSYYEVTHDERLSVDGTRVFSDLGPSTYHVTVRTIPNSDVEPIPDKEINPGMFFTRRDVQLAAGASHSETIEWQPFDPTAGKGDVSAQLTLLRGNGSPAAGSALSVSWYDGHYGMIDVFDGAVPNDGMVTISGLSSEVKTPLPFGPYRVELDGDMVGWFKLKPTTELQEFEFRRTPEAGDTAPDITLVDIDSGNSHRLSEFRGTPVLIEFWATWCGPCQPAMKKLNELAAEHPEWNGKVTLLSLNVDNTPELVAEHADDRGWSALRHFWSPRADESPSLAEKAFVVRGIPTAILISQDGVIAWRGHPSAEYSGDGISIAERVTRALGGE